MAMKRKLEDDSEDVSPITKQVKLVPFPHIQGEVDAVMFDAEPMYPDLVHSRLQSNASSISSSASDSPVTDSPYPTFDLYPLPFFSNDGTVDPNSHNFSYYSRQVSNSQVGLLQPSKAFVHHGLCFRCKWPTHYVESL
ncbi:hypothetical protein JR316_0002175 [Psilocybe cubensis]|uniref:Uncharacterized protein n=2 Tax=Psilocybe cubensis TaxID=181762 RepID=A0ACB8HB90_PSICU|nr:hypothetical protein JR316_0002175 [Psilocybe cubensis]KAH9485268.1 hypothetical protein JR316_0002175 [Psilocybe cubensis]